MQSFGSGTNQFTIDFVTIGNPGNAADTTGSPNPVGSVPYIYNLSKYEINQNSINRANAAAGLGITLANMASYGANGWNRPATGISWNEAARFVNYLNTSKGYQAAYNFTTSGANDNISLWGAGQYNGTNPYRHKDAYFFLPSLDEWYKAAYGSPSGVWFDYANGSNSVPYSVTGGFSGAVYYASYNSALIGPADVDYAGGLSPYGTMAQGGNVFEWTESALDLSNDSVTENRMLRGGSFLHEAISLSSSGAGAGPPTVATDYYGFRVASVPEPSALSLLAVGLAGLAIMRCRKTK